MSVLESKLRAAQDEIRNFMKCYPDFVIKSHVAALEQEIPVFAFHSIEPVVFQKQLHYLEENRYSTLSIEEYLLGLGGKKKNSSRCVLLTIDDGRQSVWKYAYPLLKKYGMKAVVFVLPGHTKAKNSPTHFEAQCSTVQKRDEGEPLLSWDQLRTMHSSGLVDIQSHTLYHHLIYVSPKITGVYVSSTRGPFYTLPVPKELEGSIDVDTWDMLWGMPIYEFRPLMAGHPRYLDDPLCRKACRSHYEAYLQGKKGAVVEKDMAAFLRKYLSKHGIGGRVATPQEMRREMAESLSKSRELIEDHLPGHRVKAVCWPHGAFCDQAIDIAKDVGYQACFCGTLPGRKSNRVGDNPHFTVRLKNDYIFRLPGQGRWSLGAIMAQKMGRRLRGETGY